MAAKRKVFLGTFIYPRTREELAYLHDAVVCVDEKGIIAAVREGVEWDKVRDELLSALGWEADEVLVRKCAEGDFFFPGFVGSSPSFYSHSLSLLLSSTRTIPKDQADRKQTPTSTHPSTPTSASSASQPS